LLPLAMAQAFAEEDARTTNDPAAKYQSAGSPWPTWRCTRTSTEAPPMSKAEFDKAVRSTSSAARLPRRAAQGRHRQAADHRQDAGKGTDYLKVFIKYGSPAGMPNWGTSGELTDEKWT
jgi:nitrite reductase (NO-forming)/hydroxylamine reductase